MDGIASDVGFASVVDVDMLVLMLMMLIWMVLMMLIC